MYRGFIFGSDDVKFPAASELSPDAFDEFTAELAEQNIILSSFSFDIEEKQIEILLKNWINAESAELLVNKINTFLNPQAGIVPISENLKLAWAEED